MTKKLNILKALWIFIVFSTYFDRSEQRQLKREKRQFDNNLDFFPPPSPQPGGELIFSSNGGSSPPTPTPPTTTPINNAQWVFINNRPRVATMAPFMARTTPSPQFLTCFASCPTTPQYNPICASNMELYLNEQKFNCAVQCGLNIQIVRRGSCEGLFPMSRG